MPGKTSVFFDLISVRGKCMHGQKGPHQNWFNSVPGVGRKHWLN